MSEHDLSACGNILSQTTGLTDSAINVVMAFVNSEKELCKKREDKLKETGIDAFNLFTFLAKKDDEWQKELFHSRVLQSILDPKTLHIGNIKYLRLFMDVLCETNKNTPYHQFSDDVAVDMEKSDETGNENGRIDIFIHDKTHGIIIENKLNNAPDQDNQLPRYMNIAKNRNIEVLAVVYIPTAYHEPSFLIPEIREKLVVLPANELAEKFLDKCAEESKDNELAHVYISEYAKLVKHIGGLNMTAEIDMELLEKIFSSKENIVTVKNIVAVWDNRFRLIDESARKALKQQLKWQEDSDRWVKTPVSGDGSVFLYFGMSTPKNNNDEYGCMFGFCNPDMEHWQPTTSKELKMLLEQLDFGGTIDEGKDDNVDFGYFVQYSLFTEAFNAFLEEHNWSGGKLIDFIVEKCRFLEEKAKELLRNG